MKKAVYMLIVIFAITWCIQIKSFDLMKDLNNLKSSLKKLKIQLVSTKTLGEKKKEQESEFETEEESEKQIKKIKKFTVLSEKIYNNYKSLLQYKLKSQEKVTRKEIINFKKALDDLKQKLFLDEKILLAVGEKTRKIVREIDQLKEKLKKQDLWPKNVE